MEVTFYQSSTVKINIGNVKILNDPWLVDGELYGAWNHYPKIKFQPDDFLDIDYIYLSHIHQDHFSKKTLSKINKKIPIIIQNFESKGFRNNIKNLGYNVIELDHNKKTHLKNGVNINILAADNCDPEVCYKYFGCAPVETKFGVTAIDTMCVIDDGKEVIVNTNDCPYDLSYLSASIIKEKYPSIDMLLVGYTTASAYPQCFNLTKDKKLEEKKRLQQEFLEKAENYVNLFQPKFFMPFAGRYVLAGKLAILNDYRGITELDDAFDYFKNSKNIDLVKSKCIVLNPYAVFDTISNESSEPYTKVDKIEKNRYVEDVLSKRKLDYENENEPAIEEIEVLIEKSYSRFEKKRIELQFSSDTVVIIKLSDQKFIIISCNGKGWKIINEKQLVNYKKYVKLILDLRLLKWVLMGPKYGHWHVAESGSHIFFEREPNIYERGLYYCLSFFYV
ncbi:MAG: Zn-dependent hydrolase [Thaumarchaeota archaeon]|jgi:UDP-MurNAc hydroxylase|nr:MAG: Zn-dependent hydrolase [Nitrososphaerota archaeon]